MDTGLVTVTGPGGVGKSRLAGQVARRMAGRFADGVWLVELASVREPALVQAAVAAALGVRQAPGVPVTESLTAVLARRQLLVVLDNCEHLLAAAAELCGELLSGADDVRILATSREPLRVAGEARFRLGPLALPGPDDQADALGSEAVALFADRARLADAHFEVGPETAPAVTRLVRGLDGMPLAIELAAARVEALGVAQLADRLDDRFALLAGGDRLAAERHRSLSAVVDWSYGLLREPERGVFRRLAIFPGPFTLKAAERVAGADAARTVLHLVDCSMLSPPRVGADSQSRYLMLETLRAYGAGRLATAGEEGVAAAALTRFAVGVAEDAAAGLRSAAGELAATRLLEAENATVHWALGWALEHDYDIALRLAIALAPWWLQSGRWASGYQLLATAAGATAAGGEAWCVAQLWLGVLAIGTAVPTSLGHLTAVRDALADHPPMPLLAQALAWRAGALANLGRLPEAAEEGRRALALAKELADLAGETYALYWLAATAGYAGDFQDCAAWLRQAQRLDQTAIPGWIARQCTIHLAGALGEAGETAEAQHYCADALARARQAGALYDQIDCLLIMADLDLHDSKLSEARAHLREALELYQRTSATLLLINCLSACGYLCAASKRWREAVTVWAARDAVNQATAAVRGLVDERREPLQRAREELGPIQAGAAEQRGAAMTPATAAEYALLLVTAVPEDPATPPGLPRLSARERELVMLVARGRTDAQIAEQLFISVRTVRSHLDRIRDKSGCRRRADLTRLALETGLV